MTSKPELDPTSDTLHIALKALHEKYRRQRRTWAAHIGRPYPEDRERPTPAAANEEG
jgi:hypothetical protein